MENEKIFQFRITLKETTPPVWRSFQISSSDTLKHLHEAIQAVMGWESVHPHRFTIRDTEYADAEMIDLDDAETEDESEHAIGEVVKRVNAGIRYLYDFDDYWEHNLELEKILDAEEGVIYPRCIAGARACPPEDIGGASGYVNFCLAIVEPSHPEHEMYLEWYGEVFNPEAFDLDDVNSRLQESKDASEREVAEMMAKVVQLPFEAEARDLTVRKNAVAFMTYLQKNKVIGTSSTGNLPRKTVREIAAGFVNPPDLEYERNGSRRSFRSEADVWPIYYIHLLLAESGLVSMRENRQWAVTELGEAFLQAPVLLQGWLLFSTWWASDEWFEGAILPFGEGLIDLFRSLTLSTLLEYQPGENVVFEKYVESLKKKFPPKPDSQVAEMMTMVVRMGMELMILGPLNDLGVVEVTQKRDSVEMEQVESFRLTALGRAYMAIFAE